MAAHADPTPALDDLVRRLERAAEQLRCGDLAPDAAAALVDDCAALAGAGVRRARADVPRRPQPSRSRARTPSAERRAGAAPARYPDDLRERSRRYLEGLRFSADARRPRACEEAMRYSLLAGGKRIRPVLALATARALGARRRARCCRSPRRSSSSTPTR